MIILHIDIEDKLLFCFVIVNVKCWAVCPGFERDAGGHLELNDKHGKENAHDEEGLKEGFFPEFVIVSYSTIRTNVS